MASTNKTTNYELSQFIETDRPAWLTDYNGDMRTIDSTMKAISDVASGASGSISELTDRMSTAEGNITTNANDIDALEARADSLEAQAQSTAGTIAGIQTEQTAQNLGIEAATELGYNLARPYDSASTYAVGAYVLFQNTLYKCVTAVSTGEAFDPAKWIAIKATDEIAAGGYTLPIASASQLGGVKVGNGLNIDPVSGLLSAIGGYTLPIASASQLGGVKVGDGLNIDPVSGLLSAIGGANVEIIPLTSKNITITASGTNAYTIVDNYFNDSTSGSVGTQTDFTNFSVSASFPSFYAKIGNLRLLKIMLSMSFNAVNIPGKSLFHTHCNCTISGNVIEAPDRTVGGLVETSSYDITAPRIIIDKGGELDNYKKLGTTSLLYNGKTSADSLTNLSEAFYFIYKV